MYKPKLLAKKSDCTLIVAILQSKKYTITACWVKVKFSAQKGREWMMVTLSKVHCKEALYGIDIW